MQTNVGQQTIFPTIFNFPFHILSLNFSLAKFTIHQPKVALVDDPRSALIQ